MIETMRIFYSVNVRHLISITLFMLITGCNANLNYSQYLDLPKNLYKSVGASGPAPKETGIITFDTYAIVRAKKGERLFNVADRINVSSKKLAVHNGLSENYQLGQGEILAIPLNILPDHNDGSINIAKVATKAIDRVKTEQKEEVKWFSLMRNLTMTGYYTSKVGIDELGYVGNTPNVWDGVPQDVLDQYGLSYDIDWINKCVDQSKRNETAIWDDKGNLIS